MKAILIDEYIKDYDEIVVTDIPFPTSPKEGEVLVKVEAAGVNFVDLLYARGKHQNNHRGLVKPPFVLGLEFAGTVLTSCPSSPFPINTPVYGTTVGAFTTHLSISPFQLSPIPASFSFASAAGLAATLPVSYGALITRGGLQAGETVLIHAAAGGLGLFAVQIAKAIGATVIATASSPEKLSVAKRFGADLTVNYSGPNNEKWEEEVLRLTGGKGVDVVFDTVGLVGKSLRCLKPCGRILIVGFAGREADSLEKLGVNRILLKQAKLIGYRFGETHRANPSETTKIWAALNAMIDKGLIKSTVFDKEYRGLQSVKVAMRDLSERRVWGKAVVLLVGDGGIEDDEEGKQRLKGAKL